MGTAVDPTKRPKMASSVQQMASAAAGGLGGLGRYLVPQLSWKHLQTHIKLWQQRLAKQAGSSTHSFTFRKCSSGGLEFTRLYCLGPSDTETKEHSFLYVDIPDAYLQRKNSAAVETLVWKPLFESKASLGQRTLTRHEELLRERQRCIFQGITSYEYDEAHSTFLFSIAGSVYQAVDPGEVDVAPVVSRVELGPSLPMDTQMCPQDPALIAFVTDRDIHLHLATQAHSSNPPLSNTITATNNFGRPDREHIFSGVPSFVIQEEFDRYKGMWWCPVGGDITGGEDQGPGGGGALYHLLYEETDESEVQEILITIPASSADKVEKMRYPKPGAPNAKSSLHMLQIKVSPTAGIEVCQLSLPKSLFAEYDWAEYIVRAGWLPDGSGVWAQLLSRLQDRLALILIPIHAFVPTNQQAAGVPPASSCKCVTIVEEVNPAGWVNIHDHTVFLKRPVPLPPSLSSPTPSPPLGPQAQVLQFLWSSEAATGLRHLQLVTAYLNHGELLGEVRVDALTSGPWEVTAKCALHVDEDQGVIHFLGSKDSPVESHLYCVPLAPHAPHHTEPQRITQLGMCHCTQRGGRAVVISADSRLAVDLCSNLRMQPQCVIYDLKCGDMPAPVLIVEAPLGTQKPPGTPGEESLTATCKTEPGPGPAEFQNGSMRPASSVESMEELEMVPEGANGFVTATAVLEADWPDLPEPELMSYESDLSGLTHYAILFRPLNAQPDRKYPVLLIVYAGPEVQMVRNVYFGRWGVQRYTSLGYAVVWVDGRGSAHRGRDFEHWMRHKMGTFELDDQIEGLRAVADRSGILDLDRVAIRGWSYGGYISLMALCQRPDFFRLAVVGAPVTQWELYDTGYTERYMGLPKDEPHAYYQGSVVERVSGFPDEPNRLLIFHGLIDENVHFMHTAALVSALTRAGKPYQLQTFPSERHAVRSPTVNEYMETGVLWFLQQNLTL